MRKFLKQPNRLFLYLFMILFIITSCKTSEKSYIKPKTISEFASKEERIIANIINLKPIFANFSSKLDIRSKGINLTGNLRMANDSLIWISISKFGFEIARIKLARDSVFFINKLYSEGFEGDYSFISRILGFNVNYDIIQSYLLATDFENYDMKNYQIQFSNNLTIIKFENRKSKDNTLPNISQYMFYNQNENRIEKNLLEVLNSLNKLYVEYSNYIVINEVNLPTQYNINIPNFLNQEIIISSSKHQVNIPLDYPFSIPNSYKRIR